MTATAKAVCKSNPSRVNNPAKLPSVTPNPPGDIEIEPKITDIGYMLSKLKNPIKCIPNAPKTKKKSANKCYLSRLFMTVWLYNGQFMHVNCNLLILLKL